MPHPSLSHSLGIQQLHSLIPEEHTVGGIHASKLQDIGVSHNIDSIELEEYSRIYNGASLDAIDPIIIEALADDEGNVPEEEKVDAAHKKGPRPIGKNNLKERGYLILEK